MSKKLDEWTRGESIGEGGQARTFRASKDGDPNPYVIKILKHKSSPARRKRFAQEIEVGLRLSHPNVLKVEGHNIEHEEPYIVTSLCAGGDLWNADISKLSLLAKLRLFADICHGVGHAHSEGVIHRDLKPSNIFLRESLSNPVVGDFGLCLLTEQDHRETETLEVAAPRWFGAPELEDGRLEDARPVADVYSLGKILYWLVSDKLIFNREKQNQVQFDLRLESPSASMFFVYDLFNGTIVNEPQDREYSDANKLSEAAEALIRSINLSAHYLDLAVQQPCLYCATGHYKTVIDEPEDKNGIQKRYPKMNLFGIKQQEYDHPVSWWPDWLVLACDYCGNVQMFRPDLTQKRDVWRKNG